ncbi:hypothetical protein U9M48_043683 [Paspalum notatum var. saurae]|uniref:Uncharacterized protein n=1 Tax=Paspalum notatum var. saurae TaxID=547442 RepID=A0AAQ3XHD2_PASNO
MEPLQLQRIRGPRTCPATCRPAIGAALLGAASFLSRWEPLASSPAKIVLMRGVRPSRMRVSPVKHRLTNRRPG